MSRRIEVVFLGSQTKAFHLNISLLSYGRSVLIKSPLNIQDVNILSQLPEHSREFVYYLLEYRSFGIHTVCVNSNNVVVTKKEGFDWDAIERFIINGFLLMFSQHEGDSNNTILEIRDLVVSGDISVDHHQKSG